MNTAPAASTDAPHRARPGERPEHTEVGVPVIVARTELDPEPVPVPSIALPDEPASPDQPEPDLSADPIDSSVSEVLVEPASPREVEPPTEPVAAPPPPPAAAFVAAPPPPAAAVTAAPPPPAAAVAAAPQPPAPRRRATPPPPAAAVVATPPSPGAAVPAPPAAPVRLLALPSPEVEAPSEPESRARKGDTPVAASAGPTSRTVDRQPVVDDDETFAPIVQAKLKSYVYLLVDPRTGRPFYAGLGREDRCFDHVRAAREVASRPANATTGDPPEYPALDRIRQIEASGRPVRVEILRYGLDPEEARLVEAVANDLLGLPGAPSEGSQRRPADEVRLLLTKRAKFKRSHQVVLLRVGPPGSDTSYGEVRHGWRIGRRWVEVDAERAPHWAVVVEGELIDSVYRLDRWEASPPVGGGSATDGAGDGASDRYSFVGTRDVELERRYVGKSVAPYLGKGGQSSVAYVWCGPHWVNTAL